MGAYVDSIGVTNLTTDIKTLADQTYPANTAIASIYNSSSTYVVGDYCIYNGILYKCNTEIITGESWDITHWTQTNVVTELGATEALGTDDITNNSSNVSGATATAALDTLKTAIDAILGKMYPVGSIYMSVNSTSPASLFGGTWTQIKDTFLIAAGSTYAAGATGGSATKNLQHAHTTSGHKLTVAEMPAHGHYNRIDADSQSGWSGRISYYGSGDFLNSAVYKYQSTGSHYYINSSGTANTGGGGSHSHGNTGNGLSTTFNIMPPYLSVYVWKRTA